MDGGSNPPDSTKKDIIMNQGKRKDQIEFSDKMATGSMLAMIVIILISWIWKLVG